MSTITQPTCILLAFRSSTFYSLDCLVVNFSFPCFLINFLNDCISSNQIVTTWHVDDMNQDFRISLPGWMTLMTSCLLCDPLAGNIAMYCTPRMLK